MLMTAHSHDQVVSIINQLKAEIEAAKKAPAATKKELRDLSGDAPPPAEATPPPKAPPQTAYKVPNAAAIADLKMNRTNPAVRADFDKAFGPGAAAKILGGK